jgi:cytochrome c oxidase assembly protein subunit 15
MVASGLVNRPWVNAYKLTVHLGLGISLFMYLFYTWIKERGYRPMIIEGQSKRFICFLLILVILQVCFGGMVSGMKSSLLYPTWPLMNDRWIPDILWDTTHWKWDSFLLYDHSVFVPTLVQVIHRNLAYLITLLVLVFSYGWIKSQNRRLLWVSYILIGIVLVQVLVGILILLGSHGSIPVFYGVLHQGLGILTLTFLFYIKIKANTRHITL